MYTYRRPGTCYLKDQNKSIEERMSDTMGKGLWIHNTTNISVILEVRLLNHLPYAEVTYMCSDSIEDFKLTQLKVSTILTTA